MDSLILHVVHHAYGEGLERLLGLLYGIRLDLVGQELQVEAALQFHIGEKLLVHGIEEAGTSIYRNVLTDADLQGLFLDLYLQFSQLHWNHMSIYAYINEVINM